MTYWKFSVYIIILTDLSNSESENDDRITSMSSSFQLGGSMPTKDGLSDSYGVGMKLMVLLVFNFYRLFLFNNVIILCNNFFLICILCHCFLKQWF